MIDPAIEAYAEAHTTPQPDHLALLEAETRATLAAPQMLSGPVVGRLLETLVWLSKPRLVLEIGTFSGASALWMAQALPPGGRIISLEISEAHAMVARRHIVSAGLDDVIDVRVGPALEAIAAIDEPLDFVFIDADKTGYPAYLDAVLPKLAPGGLIAADNTLRGGEVLDPANADEGTRAIAAFNDMVASHPGLVCVLLTVRDGVTLIRRAAANAA
jgi:caffeoyl-CoA O-methyltransferase